MSRGDFEGYGGRHVPEALEEPLSELAAAYDEVGKSEEFQSEFRGYLEEFAGRPTPLYYARNLSERYGAEIYLKREDLLHGGAHKINNTLGQALLAKKAGKERLIAETGAGQHGTATAMVGALAADADVPALAARSRALLEKRPLYTELETGYL